MKIYVKMMLNKLQIMKIRMKLKKMLLIEKIRMQLMISWVLGGIGISCLFSNNCPVAYMLVLTRILTLLENLQM